MFGLEPGTAILLIVGLLAALSFEFINGFHDTANAVATVIYTRSLKPRYAVIWSGTWNFIGVYVGGIAVAMGIMNLLPLDVLIGQHLTQNMIMVFSLIATAIIWNLGTWYFGIPCSSSHTLLGSIFGIGIAFMFISPDGAVALNWKKVYDAGLALLISPVIGFGLAIVLMMIFKKVVKKKKFFQEPDTTKKPPFWIRSLLILTCTSVSFSHGSNDGQKGVGLIMIILISLAPTMFAIDNTKNIRSLYGNVEAVQIYLSNVDTTSLSGSQKEKMVSINSNLAEMRMVIAKSNLKDEVQGADRSTIRKNIVLTTKTADKLLSEVDVTALGLSKKNGESLKSNLKDMKGYIEYAPWWVILSVAIALGLGTMVAWKRIVVTIGEKIGKTHMSYSQGASAEIVAASTIALSTQLGLPVSTTHMLSSGVAGSMVADGGVNNLDFKTVKTILSAWVLTIPVTVVLSAGIFLLLRWIIL